jgi:DNA-directed RNA polymerase subunit K/omega
MNSNILSKAFAVVPDKELLVNIVRLRVRQLALGHRPLIGVPPGMGLSDVALSEIADGKLSSESNTVVEPEAAAAAAIISFPDRRAMKKKAA